MQFGDDWPGVFIRGDEALAFAEALKQGRGADLIQLLQSCSCLHQEIAIQSLKPWDECLEEDL